MLYHYARLIEILGCLEQIAKLMDDPDIVSSRVRAQAGINNLIIATGNNNLAMNKAIAQIAKHYIHDHEIPEGMLNRVEAGIHCFDPCLSCSTYAAGQMPLHIELIGNDRMVVDEIYRD